MGTYRLEIPQATTNARGPKSHMGTSQRGKIFLSLKMMVATKSPAMCGCNNHIAKKCRAPKHLVELYMKFLGHTLEKKKYEKHSPSNTKTPPSGEEDFMDVDKMLAEYAFNDVYGDLIDS
jgi:hypothetical protein